MSATDTALASSGSSLLAHFKYMPQRTIRGRVLVAFFATATITGSLAIYGNTSIRLAGDLARKTYDQSLMSINYARAAAADFAAMRADYARLSMIEDSEQRTSFQIRAAKLSKSLQQDLEIAAERSQSARAKSAADRARKAVAAWTEMSEHVLDQTRLDASWDALDKIANNVDDQIDLLVNYTAGDGFLYRQAAAATVEREVRLNLAGAILALLLSGLVAWALTRKIVKPVAAASEAAKCIARGKLDVSIPSGAKDELGELLSSMGVMRDNISRMVQQEIALRQSAQVRLAEALESSREGIILVDAERKIALANAEAARFLSLTAEQLRTGTHVDALESSIRDGLRPERAVLWAKAHDTSQDVQLSDRRWVRVSRNATSDGGFMVVFSDITTSKLQEAKLRENNVLLDAALGSMSQGLCLFSADDRLQVANRRFFEIFALDALQITAGMTLQKLVHAGHQTSVVGEILADLRLRLRGDASAELETGYHDLADGRTIASVYSSTRDGGWVATFEDVTERRQADSRIMHMARHDALTDLPNRLHFRERLESLLETGEHLCILFIDLDRFKNVNDTLGHPLGDALLCAVAHRLRSALGEGDFLARLGGDEFAVLQIAAGPAQASDLAQKIVELAAKPFDVMGHHVVIGASVGIAVAPEDGRDPDQLLRNSDLALYQAKSTGRGCYQFFQPEMGIQIQTRHELEHDLRTAVECDEITVEYQPIVDVQTGRLSGFEALARWRHKKRGSVSPEIFIPLAEEIGLIAELGDRILRRACRDAAGWPNPLSVAVNLSAVQFRHATLPLCVATALGDSGLNPNRLELEITESVFLEDDRSNLEKLHAIRELGVAISMDDFGTGYSSLSYLRSFPFSKIKLDRSFVAELGQKEDCLAIIRAVAQLGINLGMRTLAEGIETKRQLDLIRQEGIGQAQGYLFGRAVPARDVFSVITRFAQLAA